MLIKNISAMQTDADVPSYGDLRVNVTSGLGAVPVSGASVVITYPDSPEPFRELTTDESGQTEVVSLPAPPFEYSQVPNGDVELLQHFKNYLI